MAIDRIQKTPEFLRVIDLFENSPRHIFLTGRAGTGKSTLLQYFRSSTRKNTAVLAPTGVAAVNIKGQTIHSFFRFRPDVSLSNVADIHLRRFQRDMYKALDTIIIDEISMVRADLFDCMDLFLRIHGKRADKPFGGVQIIMIGDLFQLPPVVTRSEAALFEEVYRSPFFFDANVFPEMDLEFMELENIWRQKEDRFIRLLNSVRDNNLEEEDLRLLNSRVIPDHVPSDGDLCVYLTATNDVADGMNRERLQALKGRVYRYEGAIAGKFEERVLPTHQQLDIKLGAQVMLLNNDPQGRWVNGSIGQVMDIIHGGSEDAVRVRLAEGQEVDIGVFTWEVYRYVLNEEAGRIESELAGAFKQYPLRLAWAVTIHRAQGKTFDRVIIDVGRGTFSHGQVYVALSRCTSFEGIILKRPILRRHIMLDERVTGVLQSLARRT